MKRTFLSIILLSAVLVSCASVDLNAPVPTFDTGVDPDSWALIPAGPFLDGST